jgi:hypothetical protein
MERLLHLPHGAPELAAGTHAAPTQPGPGGFSLLWTVVDDEPLSGCKRITVMVRWPSEASGNAVRLVDVWTRAAAGGR